MLRAFLAAALGVLVPVSAAAHTETWIEEEWIGGAWVPVAVSSGAERLALPAARAGEGAAIAAYGPFVVVDDGTAALVGSTGRDAPAQFTALLRDHPGIGVLDFVDAPGTHDDLANLALGRMIRAHGLVTRVGAGGSVRSGAVELFLAGACREIAPGAEFAVHGWLDEDGLGAQDHPASAAHHRRYLDYYAEMGMAEAHAAAFYAMTNSVPFEEALWLSGAEMQRWLAPAEKLPAPSDAPRLAYAPAF